MSRYLDRLREVDLETSHPSLLPKLPKEPYGSKDSTQGCLVSETQADPVELDPLSPAGQVAAFERLGERAAILEYEAGLPRAEAERRARREAACEGYHRTWWPVWQRGRAYLLAHPESRPPGVEVLHLQIADAVASWNQHTGDSRTQAEYLALLAPADFDDRELMTPGALALYAWTLWHD